MTLLRQLRRFQRLIAALEIGAGILPVAIQEQAIKTAIQIVMVRDIFLCTHGWVVLVQAPFQLTQECSKPQDRLTLEIPADIGTHDVEDVVDATNIGCNGAVHVSLTQGEAWIEDKRPDGAVRSDHDARRRSIVARVKTY